MLTIAVKRHAQDVKYFAPWIEDHEDRSGCTFHFHWDDISDEGVGVLSDAVTQQVRQLWRPRPLGAPTGRRIPVVMVRRTVMEDRDLIAVVDEPGYIAYMVRADLISERGAAFITRAQSEKTPYWERLPSRRRQLQTV